MFGLKPAETSVALWVLVDVNAVEAFAQGGRAQYGFPGTLNNATMSASMSASDRGTGSGWNVSAGLQVQMASPVTVDAGIWPRFRNLASGVLMLPSKQTRPRVLQRALQPPGPARSSYL